jgi:hypothetical protein
MDKGVGTKEEYKYLQNLVGKYCGAINVDLRVVSNNY